MPLCERGQITSLIRSGHKWLNVRSHLFPLLYPLIRQVPYDCGLFFTRSQHHLTQIFSQPAASAPAYLSASAGGPIVSDSNGEDGQVQHELVPSPLYVNIENSRRFRALPLFASLLSLGKDGYIGGPFLFPRHWRQGDADNYQTSSSETSSLRARLPVS